VLAEFRASVLAAIVGMLAAADVSFASRQPRVVVADDHVPTRVGIRMALEAGGFIIVGEAGTGPEAVETVLAERPDACVLDLHLPGGGIAAAEAIGVGAPETTVVMLTVSADAEELIASIQAGASGYLPKTTDARRLPAALHRTLAGEPAVPRALVGWLLDEIRERGHRRPVPHFSALDDVVGLTRREGQVLDLMWKELPTQEMAVRLGISPVTVRRHVSALMRKVGARNREAVVALLNRQRRPGRSL
jgi:two-component system, NarL family, nitrate/nitrite response regulator NarL